MLFETEEEIRRRVSRRYHRWRWFFIQLVLTLPFGLFVDSLRFSVMSRGFSNFLLAVWFASLFLHGLLIFSENAKERAIQREIERQQYLALQYGGKPKRSSRLSLGSDGELLDSVDWVADREAKDKLTD